MSASKSCMFFQHNLWMDSLKQYMYRRFSVFNGWCTLPFSASRVLYLFKLGSSISVQPWLKEWYSSNLHVFIQKQHCFKVHSFAFSFLCAFLLFKPTYAKLNSTEFSVDYFQIREYRIAEVVGEKAKRSVVETLLQYLVKIHLTKNQNKNKPSLWNNNMRAASFSFFMENRGLGK